MFEAVFFDLDGTLVDTAHDFARTINRLLVEDGKPPLALEPVRQQVSNGARALTSLAFGITPAHPDFERQLQRLLDTYAEEISARSSLFVGMDEVLSTLRENATPWGVVTNKPARFTNPIMQSLGFTDACAVICPDHVKERKPDPEGLLLAAALAHATPSRCLYVGDHERDIAAGKNAHMQTAAALYGYIETGDDPLRWQADFALASPTDLLPLIQPSKHMEPA